jgi:phage protein D
MAATAEILRDARPVFNVAGQDRSELALGLLELLVTEDADGLCRCEATFGNWGNSGNGVSFLYFDRQVLEFGKAFVVKFDDTTLFEGQVIGLEADFPDGSPPRITVLADDRLQDLRMTRRTRSWASSTDADVLRAIANDHGLSPEVDLSGPTHAEIAQVNQSDLAFARERVRAAGGELWVEGTKFVVKARSARANTNAPELAHGRNLRAFNVTADLAHQRTQVTVSGWDVSAKDGVKHDATDSLLGSELDGGDSGPSILQSALGARVDTLVHAGARDGSAAESVANAYFRGIARRFVVGHGTAEGDPGLRVGRKVELKGVGSLFNGKYVLVRTQHTFSARGGYRTEFSVERPALGKP